MRQSLGWIGLWILGWLAVPAFGQAEKASLEGLVLDEATRQPVVGAHIDASSAGGKATQTRTQSPDGSFRLSLSAREQYRIVVQAKGYVNGVENIDFSDPRVVSRVGKTIYLTKAIPPASGTTPTVASVPPSVTQTPELTAPTRKSASTTDPSLTGPRPMGTSAAEKTGFEPVFFAQSTVDILPESQRSLDKLVQFLAQNPTVVVELGGHTDNQGDFDQNVALSRQRAELVRKYVLSKGARPAQIRTRGYGGTRPVATNNYEAKRPLNRRVEVTIVSD